ncbi:DUF1653 domain-containing protein [Chromobacterium subtsugae]|uniref:DUF1653 domain-containing protein n=1 Tax=Chromobacterium subtsugae TaxID=251747 RepID=A0ABS7FGK2_9NEIS|nr:MULTISPECIES: DUF1653 domain-containing protein [Chromobacterium]KUM04840.1 hypothetical protein Cv017_12285 [Chromobacterium subtsugae]KZE87758.1 hypothetical protein AWB61_10055 [Chromobacterium sp. F49]MBW7568233.1 DUF1653 domain-containing protein [Chromobacterium subtsugae]MBW8288433.1 DUF1653 domain-containing protein [Chromobacterium subtsugae]OBU86709.1 hypothetical protein MY55_07690 [Chromobacterium subtsugae]
MPVPGIYQHYGNRRHYQLLGIARHSETGEPMAVYRALYGDFTLWTRPAGMFDETVDHEGRQMPRFSLIRAL